MHDQRFSKQAGGLILPAEPGKAGLRFPRSAARVLRNIGDRLRAEGRSDDCQLFDKAEAATRSGEALEVVFSDPGELAQMVAAFRRLGVPEPVVEDRRALL